MGVSCVVRSTSAVLVAIAGLALAAAASAGTTGGGGPPTIPLIFVPGMTGSYLGDGDLEVWPSARQLNASQRDEHLFALQLDDSGTRSLEDIAVMTEKGINGVIDRAQGCVLWAICRGEDVYDPTFEYLESPAVGYVRGQTLFAFAYDWRLSVVTNARRLSDRIDAILALDRFRNAGITKVNILAHSMGGLVVNAMLTKAFPDISGDAAPNVLRVVTLGTPNLGAVKALSQLDYGWPCQIPQGNGCMLNQTTLQEIARNMPGFLQLMPSPSYQSLVGPTVITPAGAQLTWGDVINQRLNDRNVPLVRQAADLHQRIDVWNPAGDVGLLRIVGTRNWTIKSIREKRLCGPPRFQPCVPRDSFNFVMNGNGDGTVTGNSADLCGKGPEFLDYRGGARAWYARHVEHLDLAQNPRVLDDAVRYLRGVWAPEPQVCGQPRRTEAVRAVAATCEAAGPTVMSGDSGHLEGTEVRTQGLAGTLVDETGARAGRGDEAWLREIPGSYVENWEETVASFVPCEGAYHGTWTVTARDFDVQVAVANWAENEIAQSASTLPIAARPGARLTLDVTRPVDFAALSVGVDDNADGTVDRTVPFGPPLAGEAAVDDIPPTTTISVQHRWGKKCLQSATVSATATDTGGSGVARILYNVPALGIFNAVYTGPLVLPPKGEIYVWAVDNAGNVESEYEVGVLDDHGGFREFVTEFLVPRVNETGCLDYPGDVDWWGFDLKTGKHRFQLVGLKGDYDLALYDAAGQELARSDRRGKKSEKIREELPAGRYFLQVTGFQNAWSNTHPYRIHVKTHVRSWDDDHDWDDDDGRPAPGDGACCEAAPAGPTGWWRLGDAAGSATAADVAGGRDGSYVGDPTLGAPGALAGDADTAAAFDGVEQYVEVPFGPGLNAPAFSVEAWARPAALDGAVITSRDAGSGYALVAGADGTWQLHVGDGAGVQTLSGGAVVTDRWTHVAGTYDGATATLYVDGVLVASAGVPFVPNAEQTLLIAAGLPEEAPAYFAGAIDEVTVYDRARSEGEVASAAGAGLDGPVVPVGKCCVIGPPPVN